MVRSAANWVGGVPHNKRPRFTGHANYISDCHDEGKIVPSGPFMETPGGLAGTIAIFETGDIEEATRLGTTIPTVQSSTSTPSLGGFRSMIDWAPTKPILTPDTAIA